jgi:TusE/DsrC/DsvC family sulfur relay protein
LPVQQKWWDNDAERRRVMYSAEDIKLNQRGFLADFGAWDIDVAQILAREEGMVLGESHWKIIKLMRGFYEDYQVPPSAHIICKAVTEELGAFAFPERMLKSLFTGGCKQACRIAGIPDYFCHAC